MTKLLILACFAAGCSAQVLEATIDFRDSGCAPCAASLEDRLERVRGVSHVDVDLDRGRIHLRFAADNRVRLAPLRARITQDGSTIERMAIRAIGVIGPKGFTLTSTKELLLVGSRQAIPNGKGIVTGLVSEDTKDPILLRIAVESFDLT